MRAWLTLLACLLATPLFAEIAITDDMGQTLRLPHAAQRIVSLTPHSTELLFAIGAGERGVGAPSDSDYPEAARRIPRIGGYNAIDFETVLALQPDLIVAWYSGNGPPAIERLRQLGLSVYASEPRQLEDIPRILRQLGMLTGQEGMAEHEARHFEDTLEKLRHDGPADPPITVFYQVWHQPLMTIGQGHTLNEVIRLCGGRNIFADLGTPYPTIGEEAVLQADPQVIIASGMGEPHPEWVDNWRRWTRLRAVANDHLFFIHPDLLQRPTSRLLEGARQLCEALQRVRDEEAP